jgi:8-oxo-dGTP pyrophosphatase MutT (NUDIX family)
MSDPRATIPFDQLPESFTQSVQHPPEHPVQPRPAATITLMRPSTGGLEVLLLRRTRDAGFLPGAWVFPGGQVDEQDETPALIERMDGLTPAGATARLGLPGDARPPAIAYWVAAIREAFEETGVLVARTASGEPASTASASPTTHELLADGERLASILDRLGCRMDGASIAYVAHWITPVVQPRRYDTRFFAAAVSPGTEALLDRGEAASAVWLTPAEALELNVRDSLPMVFPTIRTLEALLPFGSPEEVLVSYRDRVIPTITPRLVTTKRGIAMELEGGA